MYPVSRTVMLQMIMIWILMMSVVIGMTIVCLLYTVTEDQEAEHIVYQHDSV